MRAEARDHRIAVLAGDGIGTEVTPAAMAAMDAVAAHHDVRLRWEELPWGSDYYRTHGRMMPVDALDTLATYDAILLGAVGDPDIPDTETLWGMLIPIRRAFDQYVNLRPVRTLAGVDAVSAIPIDLLIVRENTEGEYSSIGGRYGSGVTEAAVQQAIFTRVGVERVTRYAVARALERSGRLTSATKSNGILHSMPFWDSIVREVVAGHGEIRLDSVLIDALSAGLVLRPDRYDVIVASNLFGDILSDLAAALAGSIGIAPSANLNPEKRHPSMFEPVHGSAPDIAGRGVANPVGAMWAGAMMLDHLGASAAGAELIAGFEAVLAAGTRTRDLGGTASTTEFTRAVLDAIDTGASS